MPICNWKLFPFFLFTKVNRNECSWNSIPIPVCLNWLMMTYKTLIRKNIMGRVPKKFLSLDHMYMSDNWIHNGSSNDLSRILCKNIIQIKAQISLLSDHRYRTLFKIKLFSV